MINNYMPNLEVSVIDMAGSSKVLISVPDHFTPVDVIEGVEHKIGIIDNALSKINADIETVLNMTIIRCNQQDAWNLTLIYYHP